MRTVSVNGAFSNCSSLKKINIPKSLKEGNLAFKGCNLLNEIEWENGITKIPDGLFIMAQLSRQKFNIFIMN